MDKPQRPKVTQALISATAKTFGEKHGWSDDEAADLARVCRGAYMDGYQLARDLDQECGWMPTAQDVEILDGFDSELREAHKKECAQWALDNDIQPPFPVGAIITKGEITGLCDHEPATYLVRENGCTNDGRRLLVRFEDARSVINPAEFAPVAA